MSISLLMSKILNAKLYIMKEKDYSNITCIKTEVYEITEVEKGFIFKNTEEEYRLIEKRTEYYRDGKLSSYEETSTDYKGVKVKITEQTTFLPNGESQVKRKTVNALSYATMSESTTSIDKFGNTNSWEYHDYTKTPSQVSVWIYKKTYNFDNKLTQCCVYEKSELIIKETYEYNRWNECIKKIIQHFRDGVMYEEEIIKYRTIGYYDTSCKETTTTTRYNHGSSTSPRWTESGSYKKFEYNKYGDIVSSEYSRGGIEGPWGRTYHELKYDYMNNCIEDKVHKEDYAGMSATPKRKTTLYLHSITYKRY